MIDILETLLKSPSGSFAFLLAILIVIGITIWKVSHFTTKFSSVDKLEKQIGEIKENIYYIKGHLQSMADLNNPLAQRQSPIALTKIGKEVANKLDIEKLIINHWEKISSQLNIVLTKDCNPYDIQVESFKIGETYQQILTNTELERIKTHAFESGFNLEMYNLLFGIIIRDKFLDTKEFKPEDVDSFDPNKKK